MLPRHKKSKSCFEGFLELFACKKNKKKSRVNDFPHENLGSDRIENRENINPINIRESNEQENGDPPELASIKRRIRVETKISAEDLEYTDYLNDQQERKQYPYVCPICFRYFNFILQSDCCHNYICHICAEDLNLRLNVMINIKPRCHFCNNEEFIFVDVNTKEKPRQYSDSPFNATLQSNQKLSLAGTIGGQNMNVFNEGGCSMKNQEIEKSESSSCVQKMFLITPRPLQEKILTNRSNLPSSRENEMHRFGYATVSDCFNMTTEKRKEFDDDLKPMQRNNRYSSLTNLAILANQNLYFTSCDTNQEEGDMRFNKSSQKDLYLSLPIREILHVPMNVENVFQTNSNKKKNIESKNRLRNSNKKISESIEYRMNSELFQERLNNSDFDSLQDFNDRIDEEDRHCISSLEDQDMPFRGFEFKPSNQRTIEYNLAFDHSARKSQESDKVRHLFTQTNPEGCMNPRIAEAPAFVARSYEF